MTELNINSAKESFKAWKSYLYEGNPNNYTKEQYKEIIRTYSGSISEWTLMAQKKEKDINTYHWEDDGSAKQNGYNSMKDKTEFEQTGGKRAEQQGLNSAGMIGGAISLAGGLAGSPLLFKSGMGLKAGFNAGKEATKQTTKEAAKTSARMGTSTAQRTMILVACFMALATGLAGYLSKPNKEQVDALKKLYDKEKGGFLVDADNQVADAQNDMLLAEDEMQRADSYAEYKASEADDINSQTNEDLTDQKVLYDFYKKSYDAMVKKINSNKPLDQSEKDLWEACVQIMGQTGGIIEDLCTATTDEVQGIYSDIDEETQIASDTAKDYLDSANVKMAEVDGITQYAASFDQDTKTSCVVQAVAEGINAVGGVASGIEATSLALGYSNPFTVGLAVLYYAAAGAAFAGAGLSTKNTIDQMNNSKIAAAEIDKRTQTAGLNSGAKQDINETIDRNAESLSNIQISQEFVDTLNMDVPTDVNPAEKEDLPENKTTEQEDKLTKKKDKKASKADQMQTPQTQNTTQIQQTGKKDEKNKKN